MVATQPTLLGSTEPSSPHARPRERNLQLPLELWLQIFHYSSTPALQSAALTCRTFRWLAQPMLFRTFIARLDDSSNAQLVKGDGHPFQGTLTRLAALHNPHIATAVTELRIIPDSQAISRDRSTIPVPNAIFGIVPTLTNLTKLICHDVTFTREHLSAIHGLPRLSEIELQSCATTCDVDEFPDFTNLPLETVVFDYPYGSTQAFSNTPFLSLFLQSRKLKRILAGPSDDILASIIHTHPTDLLSTLEIPTNCIGSPLLEAALGACPSVTDILFYMPIGDDHLPVLNSLPPDVLPNLKSYRGPGIYAHHFTQGRNISNIEFTLPYPYPSKLREALQNLNLDPDRSAVESFSCPLLATTDLEVEVEGGPPLLTTIYTSFPSLKKLTLRGAKIDIDTLASALTGGTHHHHHHPRIRIGIEEVQLEISTGEPRLTESWRVVVSMMFLGLLVRAYPSLRRAKLGYQPNTAVVWDRPGGTVRHGGRVVVDAKDLRVEKEAGGLSRTNAIWDAVRYKQAQ